jgi:hypothetical protein
MLLLLERTWILLPSLNINPIMAISSCPPRTAGDGHEREVARGLTNDLKRRIEKKEMNQRKRNE